MTTHELSNLLLTYPDVPIIILVDFPGLFDMTEEMLDISELVHDPDGKHEPGQVVTISTQCLPAGEWDGIEGIFNE